MDVLYDFDACEKSHRRYGGSDKKDSIIMNGNHYMVKFSDRVATNERGSLGTSYRNSTVSEYISCHIFNEIGIPAQETLLGYMGDKLVVACKDFCEDGKSLYEFEKYAVRSDILLGRYPEINDVLQIINEQTEFPKATAVERFWDTFVVDAILGNFDRHTENWGYLYDSKIENIEIAPVYDCGSCLYPKISDEGIERIINSEDEIVKRIDGYPLSTFSMNGKKVKYQDFLCSTNNRECLKSVIKISNRLDSEQIEKIIYDTPGISDIRKEFYKTMTAERIKRIIEPAREHAIKMERELRQKDRSR